MHGGRGLGSELAGSGMHRARLHDNVPADLRTYTSQGGKQSASLMPRCTDTVPDAKVAESPPISCNSAQIHRHCPRYQGGRKSSSLVQLRPDAPRPSQIPRGQKVRQSRATPPICTDTIPDWVTTDFCRTTHLFGIVAVFLILSAMVASCHPAGANLGGGSVWDVVVQPWRREGRSGTSSCNLGGGSVWDVVVQP